MAQASSARLATRLTWRIDQVFVGRRDRVAVVAAAVLVGILLPTMAGSPPAALAAASGLAVLSAGPLGLSKTATACGLNALGSFGLETRLVRSRLVDWALYAATSTASGATLGAIMWWVGSWLHSPVLLPAAAILLVFLGVRELGFIRPTPPVASRWQVPARWVHEPRRAAFVWGFWLGPGIATQMPHPSFYGLLALAAVIPWPFAPVALGLYGAMRSAPAFFVATRGAHIERQIVANAYRIRLLGHLCTGAVAIAVGVALIRAVAT